MDSLPNDVISHIVSCVSAKEAAFISVLSKRFQNLYTILPIIKFEGDLSLTDFLDEVLALPPTSLVRKFSLDNYWGDVDPVHYTHLNRCLCDVLKRGLMKLEFYIRFKQGYSLPLEVFTCKTIVKLELGAGFAIDFLPENTSLPALKTLSLCSVYFYHPSRCLFQKLLSACPVIEELRMDGVDWKAWKWSSTLSIPTLRTLIIECSSYEDFDGSDFGSLTLDLPNLICLDYNDFVPGGYPTVNLNSLVEANLDLLLAVDHAWQEGPVVEDDPVTSDPTNLINGLKNVHILNLQTRETAEMFDLFREAIPVFERLHHLTFSTDDKLQCWPFFPLLLQKAPNLKTLVIEGDLHCTQEQEATYVCKCLSRYSCLLSCPIEVLEITYYRGAVDELEQLKHFLGKLSCLKCLKVHVPDDEDKLRITTDLQMLPRASVNCQILFT